MGIETIALVAMAASTVAGGVMQNAAASDAAAEERRAAEAQARAEARENIALEKRQKLAYLKSGVELEGTPLLKLAETEDIGNQNVNEIIQGGYARANATKAQGRAALFGSIGSAAGTLAGGFGGSGGTENMAFSKGGQLSSKIGGPKKPVARPQLFGG